MRIPTGMSHRFTSTRTTRRFITGTSIKLARGPYKGQELSVDHIIPRAVVPEPDNVIANLELLPLKLNESKNAKIATPFLTPVR